MNNDIRKWLNIIVEADNVIKGPWDNKTPIKNEPSTDAKIIQFPQKPKSEDPNDPRVILRQLQNLVSSKEKDGDESPIYTRGSEYTTLKKLGIKKV